MTGVWLGIAIFAGVTAGTPAIIISIVAGALFWYGRQWSGLLWITVVLAAAIGATRGGDIEHGPTAGWTGNVLAVRGTVESVLATRGTSQSFILDADELSNGEQWRQQEIRLYVTAGLKPTVSRGDHVYFTGSLARVNEVDLGFGAYLRSIGANGSGFARRLEIDQEGSGWRRRLDAMSSGIRDQLQRAVPGDRGALLAGLVTGDDTRLTTARRNRFVATGTTHLTAVSGANLALLLMVPSWIGVRAGLRRRLLWQSSLAVAIWLYALLVGMEPPVVRAAIVATLALFAIRFGRRPDFVTLILLAAAGQALLRPQDVDRLAFQLSVVSSLALVLALQGRRPAGPRGWIESALVSVCAAHVATVAILAPTFGTISIVSLPANLLIAPAVSMSFGSAAIASIAFPISEGLGVAIASIAGLGAAYIIAVVDLLGAGTGGTLHVGGIGPISRGLLVIGSAGFVVAMSDDCKQAIRRWWARVLEFEEAAAMTAGAVVVGVMVGVVAAGWL